MGLFGVGRDAEHDVCEEALQLDIAEPEIRSAIDPNRSTAGVWRWARNGNEVGAIGFTWAHRSGCLLLSYACDGEPVVQVITLVTTTPHFGGCRWWFRCPARGDRVRVLYLPARRRRWAGRRAHGLRYAAQRQGSLERFILATGQFQVVDFIGRGGGIRTRDPQLPKLMLYQAELRPDLSPSAMRARAGQRR